MRKTLTYTVREVVPYINWTYYFHAWGMEPRFATIADIHDCPSCRAGWIASFDTNERAKAQEATKLYQETMEQLSLWADKPICHALFLLADAYSDDDDIIIAGKRIPFLRQQHADSSGHTLCLSDFVAPRRDSPAETDNIANRIGVFATSLNDEFGVSDYEHRPQLSSIIHQSPPLTHSLLADRLAEATAEKMHEEVRKHYWGYAKAEQLTMQELHAERFQGIRPAIGYPSLPDQSIIFLIDELLRFEDIGIRLSEHGAMSPHSSVSGFMFGHPKAHYFSVGNIGKDQLHDYSLRRGLPTETLRNFLVSNL